MNTLFLYDGTTASRHAVQILSSITSMSYYAVYTEQTISFAKYGRVIIVINSDMNLKEIVAALQQNLVKKEVGLIGVDMPDMAWQKICRQINEKMGELLCFTACVHTTPNNEEIIQAGERLQALVPTQSDSQDKVVLQAIETFLLRHNTCVLATGYADTVRATPIEYMYDNGKLYIFSEGGKKFANIYRNPQVSVAVFDSYAGFEKLAGLQIEGMCRMIEPDEAIYATIAEKRGITKKKIAVMPVILHVLEIKLTTAVFLWAGFLKRGKAVRQVYRFSK